MTDLDPDALETRLEAVIVCIEGLIDELGQVADLIERYGRTLGPGGVVQTLAPALGLRIAQATLGTVSSGISRYLADK